MVTAVITFGATVVNLSNVKKYEVNQDAHMPEVPIPTRDGGQVQYLGRPQRKYKITGIIPTSADLTNLQLLDTCQTSATVGSLALNYGAANIVTDTKVRVKSWDYWPVAGSTMYWWAYSVTITSAK